MFLEEEEIRRRLRARETRAPAEVWLGLESRLSELRPARRGSRALAVLAALSLLLASVALWRAKPAVRHAPSFRLTRIRTSAVESTPLIVRPDRDTVMVLLP